ncbi:MAG TPA: TRAP transporter small permease [Proteobacteria bacterium]|nr:TRAP transporter small permease [Pseudomonadota bacterium]
MSRLIRQLTRLMNLAAAVCVFAMMLLTCADVVLRLFKHPILGAYELVGLIGALGIALAMPATTLHQGHVAVEFISDKLPRKAQRICRFGADFLSLLLFALISRQTFIYAEILRKTGEVTANLQMPFYPVVYVIAAAALLVCLVLMRQLFPGADEVTSS